MNKCILFPAVIILSACSKAPTESYKDKVDRYEQGIAMTTVEDHIKKAEELSIAPVNPVLIDSYRNHQPHNEN